MRSVYALVKNNLKIMILKKPVYTILTVVFPLIIFLFAPKIIDGSITEINANSTYIDQKKNKDRMQCIFTPHNMKRIV